MVTRGVETKNVALELSRKSKRKRSCCVVLLSQSYSFVTPSDLSN